jgi:hypothetical protein
VIFCLYPLYIYVRGSESRPYFVRGIMDATVVLIVTLYRAKPTNGGM